MPDARKRPCTICRRWFRPDTRVGDRQRACGKPECQTARRQKTQTNWRTRNPGYAISWRIDRRATPAPLNQLPWDLAKDQFGSQDTDFIGVMGALMARAVKDQFRPYLIDPAGVPNTLPLSPQKTSSGFPHTRTQPENHATGVSPTGPAMGASASPRATPPAPTAGVAG